MVSNYIEQLLILVFMITGCIWISAFPLLSNFAIGLKVCVTDAGIKKYMSIIKKKETSMIK